MQTSVQPHDQYKWFLCLVDIQEIRCNRIKHTFDEKQRFWNSAHGVDYFPSLFLGRVMFLRTCKRIYAPNVGRRYFVSRHSQIKPEIH